VDPPARRDRAARGLPLRRGRAHDRAGLFFVAALLEGFFRQLVHGVVPRMLVATATTILWIVYFARGKRAAEAG
jgi:hypothetical protein